MDILESFRGLFSNKMYIKPSAGDEKIKFVEKTYVNWLILAEKVHEVDQSLGSDVKNKLKSYSFQDAVSKLLIKADRSTEWTFFPQLSSTLTSLERDIKICESICVDEESKNSDATVLELRKSLETLTMNADIDYLTSKKDMIIYVASIHAVVDEIMYSDNELLSEIIYAYGPLIDLWFEVELRKKLHSIQ